jgi:hypothetical protein
MFLEFKFWCEFLVNNLCNPAGFMVVSESERGARGFGLRNESGRGCALCCVVRESEREVGKKKKNRLKNNI